MTAKRIIELIKESINTYQQMEYEYEAEGDLGLASACEHRVAALELILEHIKEEDAKK